MASRSRERIETAASEIGAEPFVHDMSDLDGVPGLLAGVQERLGGPVEVLITNSGGPPAGPDPLAFSREQWEAAYRMLILGPVALIEQALPSMRERGWGRVVAVSSASVREPIPEIVLSNAHRSGLLATFRTIARAVAADGVTLNSLLTGQIATERLFSLRGGREAAAEHARRGGARRARRRRPRRWPRPPSSCARRARRTSPARPSASTGARRTPSSTPSGNRTRATGVKGLRAHRYTMGARVGVSLCRGVRRICESWFDEA